MTTAAFSRRNLLASLGAATLAGLPLHAAEMIELRWSDLLPAGTSLSPALRLAPHDEMAPASGQPPSTGVRTDWNGKTVRLPGFIVPLTYSGTGVTDFLLVPYVGACIHVPPPPANQLVLVTTEQPYESEGLFDPVMVTGMFGTSATSTEIAAVGYALAAERIEPHGLR